MKNYFKKLINLIADSWKLKPTRGFAVLFTVLISSIILAIALGITSVSYQEVVLSSSAKEGNMAFYAADTGAECALYWDAQGIFGQSLGQFNCDNQATLFDTTGKTSPFSFDILLNNNTSCAKVTVTKDSPNLGDTKIESLGYNVACGQVSLGGPRIVERAIRVTYGTSSGGPSLSACGNGIIESGEQCDDSNVISNDGCSATCQTELPPPPPPPAE